jgi:pimeloyl-ACP methyl ester carboxylesterase
MKRFMAGAGIGVPRAERQLPAEPPPPEMAEAFGRVQGNVDFFLVHGFRPIGLYIPDVAALRGGPVRIVVGVGETSAGSMPYRTAVALAERLGREPVSFPGGHGGHNDDPAAFAEKLHQVLRGA